MGLSQLKPSDLSTILQYGSWPSSNFLANLLGVNTPLFLCNRWFSFHTFLHICVSEMKEHLLDYPL
jgi:hypothetical protein